MNNLNQYSDVGSTSVSYCSKTESNNNIGADFAVAVSQIASDIGNGGVAEALGAGAVFRCSHIFDCW